MLMKAQTIFLSGGKARPIWRFFLSVVMIILAVIAAQYLLGFAFGVAGTPPGFFLANASFTLLMLPLLLGIFKILTAVFEQKPLGSAGLALRGRWGSELAIGLGVGALMILGVAALEWALGAVRFSWSGEGLKLLLTWGVGLFVVLAVAAANEEQIFRGYPFQRLIDSIGAIGAIAVLSALFGLMHLWNPNRTWVSTANTMLVGIPFSIAYLRTRMLWLPIGMHFAWNFAQGFVLGLPVSGLQVPVSLLKSEAVGSALLTGGDYGPEAGLLTTAIIVLATGYLAFAKSIYITEETRILVFAPEDNRGQRLVALGLNVASSESSAGDPQQD